MRRYCSTTLATAHASSVPRPPARALAAPPSRDDVEALVAAARGAFRKEKRRASVAGVAEPRHPTTNPTKDQIAKLVAGVAAAAIPALDDGPSLALELPLEAASPAWWPDEDL